jgi:hypothetical protein
MTRAPAQKHRGPGLRVYHTIYRQTRRLAFSAPAANARLVARGSHKRDRRPPHVRWNLRCPPQNLTSVLSAGDPTVLGPPFPLLPFLWCRRTNCRCGSPTQTSRPRTRAAEFLHQAEPRDCIGPACVCPDLELRQGLVLPMPYPVACGETVSPRCRASHERSGPCFTLGLNRLRFPRSLLSTGGTLPDLDEDV